MKSVFRTFLSNHILIASLKVSLVVGTILNMINQWGALFGDENISWLHVALNYLVPFCVAGYSAAKNELRFMSEE